jgi:anti-sigma factor RsiW
VSPDLSHEEIESLLGAHALDALEPEEAAAIEAHLKTCPRCRAEIDEHRLVAGAIGNTVEELPPHLWDRIAARLGSLGRTAPPEGPPGLERAGQEPGPASEEDAAIVPITTGRRRRPLRWAAAALAAAAVAAIAVLGVNLAQANNQITQLSGTGERAAVAQALQQPDHQVIDLRTPGGEPQALVVLLPNGRGYFTQSTLPAVGAAQTYQLWAKSAGRFISIGLLGPHPGDAGFTVNPKTIQAVAVTVEPAGGVTSPDRTPVVSGAVA